MDNVEMISVITLTYNKFEHLAQTIKSVLAQDYPRIEYIIADDASENFPEEQVMELIQTYQKSNVVRFRLLKNEANVGTVRNINHAYQTASGKYMVNLSCGDVFFETSTLSKIAERFQSSGCRVLVASRIKYDGDLKPICFMPHYHERALIHRYDTPLKQYKAFILGVYYDMASGSAMYFTRDIIEEMAYFDERYRLWEDGPFLAKYLWKYPILICVSGSCKILLDNGTEKKVVPLEKPYEGLYVANDMWREMYDFSPGAVLAVLASELYDESDYIRDYDEFLAYVRKEAER